MNEILLVVDEYNRLPESLFANLGITQNGQRFTLDSFIGQDFLRLIAPNDYYQYTDGLFAPASPAHYQELFYADGSTLLTVVGVLRLREDAPGSFFSTGFAHTAALTDYVISQAAASDIARAALERPNTNIFTGAAFSGENQQRRVHQAIGADLTPVSISIFPADFAGAEAIMAYLDEFNNLRPLYQQVTYTNIAEMISGMTSTLVGLISTVLIGFASISLVVSTIMIGIVTSVSVIERTKEIGILRSVGARKKDISRVFSSEAVIIGLTAGLIGVGVAYGLSLVINLIAAQFDAALSSIAALTPINAAILVGGSMTLTIIAGFFPSKMAARKDPVAALRTE